MNAAQAVARGRKPAFEPPLPADQVKSDFTPEDPAMLARDKLEADMVELQAVEQHVRLDNMNKDQLANYAMRAFGVRIDASDPTVDVAHTVRNLRRQRGI